MHDALVVGLGAMGSAALYHLAASGARVVGVDAYDPPHTLGSTHGRSRIIREAYYEHPSYVPLVRRAYENWAALERASGATLFRQTGGLMLGSPESALVRGTLESAAIHDIAVETLDGRALAHRFPVLTPEPDMIGIFEQRAGILFPEACISAHLSLAKAYGADVRTDARILSLVHENDHVVATTIDGSISARRVVIAAGPWARPLLETLGVSLPLEVERQTMHWFEAAHGETNLGPDHVPVMLVEHSPGRMFYVMPDLGDGVKAAIHYEGRVVTPDTVNRGVTAADSAPLRELLERFIPAAAGAVRDSVVCLYTKTPDLDFLIDAADGLPNALIVSACSGHGFKFASAIGEAAAQWSLGEQPDVDLTHFRANRF